jgi:hypothetical protein
MFCENCASPLGVVNQPFQVNAGTQPGMNPQPSQKPMIALVLAISAVFCCGPFTGLPSAIVAWLELTAIKEGRSSPDGRTMATIALWGGVIATVIHIGLWFLWMLFGAMASTPYGY